MNKPQKQYEFSSPNDIEKYVLAKARRAYKDAQKQIDYAINERKRLRTIILRLQEEGWVLYEVSEAAMKQLSNDLDLRDTIQNIGGGLGR